ncbi:MAG TPA: hypothetical protein VE843_05975 [Ktedonobacteraceae bacterium]|nr:hypothetical protein [Ktedonobacteraceae bacterium]
MQGMMLREQSLGRIAIVVLLIIQCILGLVFSLPFLADLLAPGRPVIVSGTSILTGPIVGAALGVALASPIIAWGLWKLKSWAPQRTLLLEIMSLVIGAFSLTQAEINRTLLLSLIGCAVLILLCWFADPDVRTITSLSRSATSASTTRKQA